MRRDHSTAGQKSEHVCTSKWLEEGNREEKQRKEKICSRRRVLAGMVVEVIMSMHARFTIRENE